MDYLRDLSDFLDDLPDRDPYDPIVLQLPSLESKLTVLLRKLRAQMDAIKEAKRARACLRATEEDTSAHNLDADWVVARKRTRARDHLAPRVNRARTGRAPIAREIEVPMSANMSLRCTEIPDASAIRADGVLYYIPQLRRFAMRIAGFVLMGNIGIVYNSELSPQKIRECNMQASCNYATCSYYHNPLTWPGSTDIRNFAATSWVYRHAAASGPKKMRKLSSRAHLDEDIRTITSADLSYYNEQLMHDLLCGIIMNYYVRNA
jgi:hypothetical protein